MKEQKNVIRIICLVTLLSFISLFSELPPEIYKELQDISEEYVNIQIDKVETTPKENTHNQIIVKVSATVKEVYRTTSNLKSGDQIIINYLTVNSGQNSANNSINLLKVQTLYTSYLKLNTSIKMYEPSADIKSFTELAKVN